MKNRIDWIFFDCFNTLLAEPRGDERFPYLTPSADLPVRYGFYGSLLADLGAEVIKIERPDSGDDARRFGPHVGGESAYFMLLNRNKKSMTLNLKSERGRELLRSLASTSDVLIENFRPGVAARLGIDHAALEPLNPSLVYASISGFGQKGPLAGRPAYDPVVQAMSGIMDVTGQRDGPPTAVGESISDVCAGMFAAWGITTALFARERTGRGRRVPMLDSVFAMMLTVLALGVCRIWRTVSDKIRARPGECREFTMSDPFKPVDRDTPYLLPPSLQDWLPQEHLARFVVEIVDRLDLSELERAYGGRGKTPYHPAVMVALLFYGYATGVFSSRKLEQATYDSVAFRYITADTHPDHDTIAHFRKRFLEPLRGVFVQILVIAQAMGVLKIGTVSLDGTKVKANASKHKAMSWGYANRLEAQLREEVQTLLEQAARADTEASPGLDIPEELERCEARLAAIERAKAEIERRALKRYEAEQAEYEEKLARRRDTEKATGKKARGREPKAPEPGPRAKDQVNFTDEESRIMPSSEGFVQGYNAQAAVDIDSHLIVAEHVSDHTNDKQELAPALRCLDERQEVVGQPRALLADAGYFSDENVKRCEAEGIEPYIASGRERHHRPLAERLAPVPECPAQGDGVAAMRHRMKTPEGRALYAKRKSTVETVFGVVKEVMGFRRFHLRGLEAVQGEWTLVCMAWNVKRMHVAVA